MKTKKLYICPAIRAHKLKLHSTILDGSGSTHIEGTPGTTENEGDNEGAAKRSRFSYDGFGTKADNTTSDDWR